MGVLRDVGNTNLSLPRLEAVGGLDRPRDAFLDAVKAAAAGDYDVYGEIGRGADGSTVFLARGQDDRRLVVLKLAPSGGLGGEYTLEVVKQLDASVAAPESICPRCRAQLRHWGRFCTICGADTWGDPVQPGEHTREELLAAVREVAGSRFEVLGEIPRAHGGGYVYFGRERASGKLVALRLLPESDGEYSLGQTEVLRRLAASVESMRGASPRPYPSPPPTPPPTPPPFFREPAVPSRRPAPPPAARRPAPPPPPTAAEQWSQVLEFLRQPVVTAVVIVSLAVVVAAVCWVAVSGGREDEPVVAEEVLPAPVTEAAPRMLGVERPLAYSVAIASVRTLREAQARQAGWAVPETPLYVAPTLVRGGVYYRLLAGTLVDREQAEALLRRLLAAGVKETASEWDVRPTRYAYRLGTYGSALEADAALERLLARGVPAYEVPASFAGSFHIYAGGYESHEEAGYLGDLLQQLGVPAELVERSGAVP